MYEQLTRSIDAGMPSLVASLVPVGAVSRELEGANNSPMEVAGKGQEALTILLKSSVSGDD
jgi:hypothetical protein